MDVAFPYTRYACPCTENAAPNALLGKRSSQVVEDSGDEEHTFNPHDTRANYSLYPLDHLLFCDECNQIRCPKCWTEEMMYWFCPNCLFEVPSSGVKSDGNRCTRHCYDCPLCAANLAVTAVNRKSDNSLLKPDSTSTSGESYILHCQYCDWSSLDIGVKFNKPTKITEQLSRLWKAKHAPSEEQEDKRKEQEEKRPLPHDTAFQHLHTFYREQLSESGDQQNPYSGSPYSSPANLARIMSLYGGLSYNALKKTREKPQPMRESQGQSEGLEIYTADETRNYEETLHRMKTCGWDGCVSQEQRLAAPSNYDARFADQLWPVATALKARRGKRCRACRQYLVRPETRVGSLRYKIRLLSVNHIQRLSIRPLHGAPPLQTASFHLRPEAIEEVSLSPYQTQQYVLTVRNPVFETVKVTLATPATTPGRIASRVTILCPSFTVGPAGDMWEDALSASATSTNSDGSRRAAMASLTGSADGDRQPEAGKIWEKSRNTTSVILEVVPGALGRRPSIVSNPAEEPDEGALAEDDDVLEIPVYVRAEWEASPHDHPSDPAQPAAKVEREHRELAYWCVLGVGRIADVHGVD